MVNVLTKIVRMVVKVNVLTRGAGKKGQITFFILIGVVLMIVFGTLFFLAGRVATEGTDVDISRGVENVLKTTSIKYYVSTCLEQSLIEGLGLIGKQGGFIFPGQPGSILYAEQDGNMVPWEVRREQYEGYNISYHLYKPIEPADATEQAYQEVKGLPEHPVSNTYVSGCTCDRGINCHECYSYTNQLEDGDYELAYTFGNPISDAMRYYYQSQGIIPHYNLCRTKYQGISTTWCDCSSTNCKFSVQEQLEKFIENRTLVCANLTQLTGYNISYGQVNATVTPSENDVSVLLKFPVVITLAGEEPITQVEQFFAYQPVRLNHIYALIWGIESGPVVETDSMLYKDTTNATYHIIDDTRLFLTDNELDFLDVTRVQTFSRDYDIIIVNDTSTRHLLAGKHYSFQFVRENRRPALDYYNPHYCYNSLDGLRYNVCVLENETVRIEPTAFDPDNPELDEIDRYTYHGWKSNSRGPSDIDEADTLGRNYWEDSMMYLTGDDCYNEYSNLNESLRCAEYETDEDDIGPHIVAVQVYDSAGLDDYQDVSVYVNDKPEPFIETKFQEGSCKKLNTDGSVTNYKWRFGQDGGGNYDYILEGNCVDISSLNYYFTWYRDNGYLGSVPTDPVPTVAMPEDLDRPCEHNYSTNEFKLASGNKPQNYTVMLHVEDDMTPTGIGESQIYVLEVWPDLDGDGWCNFGSDVRDISNDLHDNDATICPDCPELGYCDDGKDNDQDEGFGVPDYEITTGMDCGDEDCRGQPGPDGGDLCCMDVSDCGRQGECSSCSSIGTYEGNDCSFTSTADCGECRQCDNGWCIAAYEGVQDHNSPGLCEDETNDDSRRCSGPDVPCSPPEFPGQMCAGTEYSVREDMEKWCNAGVCNSCSCYSGYSSCDPIPIYSECGVGDQRSC